MTLTLLSVAVFGEKYNVPDRNFGRPLPVEDTRLADGSTDPSARPKLTRPSRRFSRPHTLLIPTKSSAVKNTHSVDKEVNNEPSEMLLNPSNFQPAEVDISETIRVSVEDKFSLAGGNGDSEAAKMSQPDVPPVQNDGTESECNNPSHTLANTSDAVGMDRVNKTRQVKLKVRKMRPSVRPTLPSRFSCLLSTNSSMGQQNGTLCNSICNVTTYVEYVRPYLTYLHQLASDAYDAQSEKQSIVQAKVKNGPQKNITSHRGVKAVKWSVPKIAFRKKPIRTQSTNEILNAESATAVASADTKSTTQDTHISSTAHDQTLLERNITMLNNIVASKDATVRALVQRLSLLEEELSTLRHTPMALSEAPQVASTVISAVVESEVRVNPSGTGLTNPIPSEIAVECNKTQSASVDFTAIVSVTGADVAAEDSDITSASETYELLQHVLNALYIVSTTAEDVPVKNLPEIAKSALNDEEVATDQATGTELAAESVLPVPIERVRVESPSIVDSVIVERQILEQYLQRVYDAAAVLAVALPYSVETETISAPTNNIADSTCHDGSMSTMDDIPSATNNNDMHSQTTPNPLQAVVETLEDQVKVLNSELKHISAQLCHYRGQQFTPIIDTVEEGLDSASAKKFWFW